MEQMDDHSTCKDDRSRLEPEADAGLVDRWTRQGCEIVGNTGYPELGHVASVARRLLPPRTAYRARLLATAALRPAMHRRARAFASRAPLKLQLGSGRFPEPGWVNVDLAGAPVELAWDITRPLPFPDATADAVFHEHVLEHLETHDALALLRDCYRVLKRGGVLRVGVPDAGAYARSYAGADDLLSRVRPGRPTAMLALQEVFYWSGHRLAFDAETLVYFFRLAGFSHPAAKRFGDSALERAPDHEHRRLETLYVEAQRLE